jgi:predicted ATPase/class 3 adenylate cyclase
MRFCGNCGTRLPVNATTPPATAMDQPAGDATATPTEQVGIMMGADLLERLRRAGLEASGQRRSVTVLFVDLTGYTTLSGQLDNEDVFDLIQEYIQLMVNDVYKYEGIVDKLTGDGLMALYGAPIAHENNAERAVRSALDMQASLEAIRGDVKKRLNVDLNMRIGLHSGSVIVGGIGSNYLMDYTAIGDTVNLARRIEEVAEPGTVLVSEAVYQQTYRLFDYQPRTGQNLKGFDAPVAAYQLLQPRSHPASMRGLEGLRAPMIGRDEQLLHLSQAVIALVEEKRGQLVMVTGEAGIGKSRLKTELKSQVAGKQVRILEGSSLTYRRAISYWIFLEILRDDLQITPATSSEEASRRLSRSAHLALGGRAKELLPYLEHLLALPLSDPQATERLQYLDASQLRQQIFLAVRDLLVAEANRQPLILILEDLHWADDASLDLLYFMLEATRQAPIMIYAISRPFQEGLLQKVADWAEKNISDRYLFIRLQSLTRDESNHLLSKLLAITDLPEKFRLQILERSAGVPFYLEEILRMLIDRGVLQRKEQTWQITAVSGATNLGVPDTLQGLILARFDRLNEHQRRLLQVASVIGHEFGLDLLSSMLKLADGMQIESDLAMLVEREYIAPVDPEPATRFSFRHVLMSEAIYSTLLKRDRARLHGEVGGTIEALYAAGLEDQVELLARHYSWSTRLDRALHFLILAGQKSASRYVNEQAHQHYEQALELLPQVEHTPEQARQVYTGLGDVLSLVGDYQAARNHFQKALELLESEPVKEIAAVCSALQRKTARTLERQGDYDQALKHLEEAQHCLGQTDHLHAGELAQVFNDIGWIHFRLGNFPEAEKLLLQALELVRNSGAYDAIASIYNRLGGITYNQGDWNRTAEYLRESIVIRESIGEVVGLATSLNNLGLLGIEMGDYEAALENLTRAYELKTRLGQAEGISMALNNLGWLRIQRGELDEAAGCLNQAMELVRQIGYTSLQGQVLKNFGEMYMAARDWSSARKALLETAGILSELRAHDQLVDTYRLLGEVALGEGDLAEARACSEKIQNLTISLGDGTTELSTVQRGEFWRFRGLLAARLREFESAQRFLEESRKIFDVLGSRLYRGRAAKALGELAEARQDADNARRYFAEAADLFKNVGASLEESHSREALIRLGA